MKHFLCVFLLVLLVSCKTSYRKIAVSSISENEKQRVYSFGQRIIETCKTREFIQLSKKEVTDGLAKLSLEEMQKACDVLDKRNGKFSGIIFREWKDDYIPYK